MGICGLFLPFWYWFSLSVGRFAVVGLMSFFHFFNQKGVRCGSSFHGPLYSRHLFHSLKLSFDHFEKDAGLALPGSLYLLWEVWYLNTWHSYSGNSAAEPFLNYSKCTIFVVVRYSAVLRIRNEGPYHGSEFFYSKSRVRTIPDPGSVSASKNLSIFSPTNCSLGKIIWDNHPGFGIFSHPGSKTRIQG